VQSTIGSHSRRLNDYAVTTEPRLWFAPCDRRESNTIASTLVLLKRLVDHRVRFVVVGGMAGTLHGSGLVTEDLDICAPLDPENLPVILAALRGLHPIFRMRPDQMALPEDPERLAGFNNLYLKTDLGQIDILSEISGLGGYDQALRCSLEINLDGVRGRVLDLDALIKSKRALGRPKDLQAVAELEAIRQRIRDRKP